MFSNFDNDVSVPPVKSYDELALIMKESGEFSPEDTRSSIEEMRGITRSEDVQVGIKKILLGIETAKQDEHNMASRFASVVARAIAERPTYGL